MARILLARFPDRGTTTVRTTAAVVDMRPPDMKPAAATLSLDSTESKVLTGVDARSVSSEESDASTTRVKSLEAMSTPISPARERFAMAQHFQYYEVGGAMKLTGNQYNDPSLKKVIDRASSKIRRSSIATFDCKNLFNTTIYPRYFAHDMIIFIHEIAQFHGIRKSTSKSKKINVYQEQGSRQKMAVMAYKVCDEVEKLFKEEPRMLRVPQPCLVFGDTHGNLSDVLNMEDMFWKSYPALSPHNFLFLGDFVDRGPFSFEVVSYFFCQKILAPSKFLLIRGNHEFRSVNKNFSFRIEMYEKFGATEGEKLYERFSKVFEWLPIAAVIDEKVFCAHGGVPSFNGDVCHLSRIDHIPAPLEDDGAYSVNPPIYRELVWNDPIDKQAYEDVTAGLVGGQMDHQQQKTGFLPNTKRGTGRYWSEKATRNFLRVNHLDFVIRAHEVAVNGYNHHHNGLVTTVFSSSNYQNSNDAGAVMVQDFKLRPIKIIPGRSVK